MKSKRIRYNLICEGSKGYCSKDGWIAIYKYNSKVILLRIILNLKTALGENYGNFNLKSFKFETDK